MGFLNQGPVGVARRRITVVLAATMLVAAGCGGTVSPSGPSATPTVQPSAPTTTQSANATATDEGPTEANPVTITIAMPANILYAAFYVGIAEGIYLKHGIDLKIDLVSSGREAVNALQSGQAQLVNSTWPSTVPVVAQGVPLKVFGIITGHPDAYDYDGALTMVVGPNVTAQSVAELKGLRIADQAGGGSDAWVHAVLEKAGLDPSKDVKLVNANSADFLSVMSTGGADAAGGTEPWGSEILAELPGSRLLTRGGGVSEARSLIAALGSWIDANPAVVDHIVAAHLEASQYLRQHPDQAATDTSHYVTGLDPAVLTAALKAVAYDPRWGDAIERSFTDETQTLLQSGAITSAPQTSDILDLPALTTTVQKYSQFLSDLN